MQGSYLGPDFAQAEIESRLTDEGARFAVVTDDELIDWLCDGRWRPGKAIGWFQGRMEFGPRRSAAARSSAMRALRYAVAGST